MDRDIFLSILSMDSYNRSYGQGLNELPVNANVTKLGKATIVTDSVIELGEDAQSSGFYALAYDMSQVAGFAPGQTVVSFRGTDSFPSDPFHGWSLGLGNTDSAQGRLAVEFYQAVAGDGNWRSANILLTGHSLGGGLAGYVGALYDQDATLFDSMTFEQAVSNTANFTATLWDGTTHFQYVGLKPSDVEGYTPPSGWSVTSIEPKASAELIEHVYGASAPQDSNLDGIAGYYVEGELLETMLPLRDGIPELHPLSLGEGVDLVPLADGRALHSMSTMVIRLFADGGSLTGEALATDWEKSAKYFWPVLYDNAFATAMGVNLAGTSDASEKLRTILAYSAIDEGERPFGDTGIRALYDDANDLGGALNVAGAGSSVEALGRALSETLVTFAGQLALNKTLSSASPQAGAGVLTYTAQPGNDTLAVNLSENYWGLTLANPLNGAVLAREHLMTALDAHADVSRALTAANDLWGTTGTAAIDQIVFALEGGVLTLPAKPITHERASLIIGSEAGDLITGTAADEILIGGAGDDILHGGAGNDILVGGLGSDIIDGGAGYDIVTDVAALTLSVDTAGIYLSRSDDAASFDELRNIEEVRLGAADDDIYITSINQGLLIDAAGGNDTLYLDLSNIAADQIYHDEARDKLYFVMGDTQTYTLDVLNVENIQTTGIGTITVLPNLSTDKTLKGVYNEDKISSHVTSGYEYNYSHASSSATITFAGFFGFHIASAFDIVERGVIGFVNTHIESTVLVNGVLHQGDVYTSYAELNENDLQFGMWTYPANYTLTGTNFGDSVYIDNYLISYADSYLHRGGAKFISGTGDDLITMDGGSVLYTGGHDIIYSGSSSNSGGFGLSVLGFASDISLDDLSITSEGLSIYINIRNHGTVTVHNHLNYFLNESDETVKRPSVLFLLHSEGVYIEPDGDRFVRSYDGSGNLVSIHGNYFEVAGDASPDFRAISILGTSGDNNIAGGYGPDTLDGKDGDDYIDASFGDDVIYGGSGVNHLFGGSGTDAFHLDAGTNYASGGDGHDRYLISGISWNEIFDDKGANDVVLSDYDMSDLSYQISGSLLAVYNKISGEQVFSFSHVENLSSISFADGSSLNAESFLAQAYTLPIVNVPGFGVTFDARGEARSAEYILTGGNDLFWGSAYRDVVRGGPQNDEILGHAGNDALYGDAGDDLFFGGAGDDLIEGSAGVDAVSYYYAPTAVHIDLSSGRADDGEGGNDAVFQIENVFAGAFDDTVIGSEEVNALYGNSGNDTLEGRGGNDTLDGYTGNDALLGGDGDDLLFAGAGRDHFDGGAGKDGVSYFYAAGSINVDMRTGAVSADGDLGQDTLTEIEDIYGSAHADIVRGSGSANLFYGNDGNDKLYGYGGSDDLRGGMDNDTLEGGDDNDYLEGWSGDDILKGGNDADVLRGGAGDDVIDGGGGYDTATYGDATASVLVDLNNSAAQDTGGSGRDTIVRIENLIGSSYNDVLTGSAGTNRIEGGGGDDILDGGAGKDTLSYASASAGVAISLAISSAQNTGGAGIDTIANFENLVGSTRNDILIGSDDANLIEGGAGDDVIRGGKGSDTLSYASAQAGVIVSLAITASQQTVGAGRDTISEFEKMIGSSFHDFLTGDQLANVIEGGAGNDVMDGGAGSDTVSYAGATSGVSVSLGSPVMQDTGGAGWDTLANFEKLVGSAYNDQLFGDALSNTINGGNGDDYIEGGAGNDTLNGGGGIDTAGFISASSGVTVSLAINISQDTGAGRDKIAAFENLTGSSYNDTLSGDDLGNVLRGEAGDDRLVGLDGHDILYGDAGADQLSGGLGADTFVWDFAGLSADIDQVLDFEIGDVLDISGALSLYDPLSTALNSFISVVEGTNSTTLWIDAAGSAVFGVNAQGIELLGRTNILSGGVGSVATQAELLAFASDGTLII